MIVRLALSTASTSDLADVVRFFNEDLMPVFTRDRECVSAELVVECRDAPDGLIEVGAISRWRSLEAMEAALARSDLAARQRRILEMLRNEPIVKVYRVLEYQPDD